MLKKIKILKLKFLIGLAFGMQDNFSSLVSLMIGLFFYIAVESSIFVNKFYNLFRFTKYREATS